MLLCAFLWPRTAAMSQGTPSRCSSQSEILDMEMRIFWRSQLGKLHKDLVEAFICDEPVSSERKVRNWMLSVEPTLAADEKLFDSTLTWICSQRTSTLRILTQRFETLRCQDNQRARDMHEAARAFQKEYEALLDATDYAMH